ncbi:MAG: hypothetical protein H6Q65_1508 [Firmicutes bacterium]|nr:hypothetical protein [Bacillota bacterium]
MLMEVWQIARDLENTFQRQLDLFSGISSPWLVSIMHYLQNVQGLFLENLSEAAIVNVDTANYPSLEASLINENTEWNEMVENLPSLKTTEDLVLLWSIYAAFDKLEQFYRQAALNSPHPLTRAYFQSLSENKMLFRRRIGGFLRILYNDVWGKIGFAPFVLGRE